MPSVRYYDYGVLRMESDQRMLDAQRRSAHTMPMHRVVPDYAEQTRPAAESEPIRSPDARDCDVCNDSASSCAEEHGRNACAETLHSGRLPVRLSGEELLIAALLLLALSEGCELPLILALAYLLL